MKIYEIAVKRPVTALMLILSFVFFGAISFTRTSVDMFPDVNMPIAMVMTTYNAGPQEVEDIVTSTIETAVSSVPNVKMIQSTSSEGTSLVIVQFEDDVDMDAAMFKMDQYISMASEYLPDGVSDPSILSLDPTQIPVVEASISSDTMTQSELYRHLETSILPTLEATNGVSSVSVIGANESQVSITVKQDELVKNGFALNNLMAQIQADNVSLPGGMTKDGDFNLNLKVDGKYKSLEDIEDIILTSPLGKQLKLKDIATVKLVDTETKTIFRSNSKSSIALSFNKESTANIIDTAKEIQTKLEDIEKENEGISTFVTQDQSTFIQESVNNVLSSAVLGMVLAVLVLLFFLRDLKTSLIIGLAMPISIVSTFTFLYMLDISMNLISLGGLTFAVGMLVDNSIIVLENIYRHYEEGKTKVDAAIIGTKEIFWPVFSSTLTNIAIFLPIIFTGGMIGKWLSNLALTITVSLLCSLLVSVTVIPMFASLFMQKSKSANILDKGNTSKTYAKALDFSLNKKALIIFVSIIATFGSVGLALTSGMEMIPSLASNSFSVNVSVAHGTQIEVTDSLAKKLEEKIANLDYVEDYHVNIGTSSMGVADSSKLTITVNTKDLKDTGKTSSEIVSELETLTKETITNNTSVEVSNNGSLAMLGGMMTEGITFNLEGVNTDTLATEADRIVTELRKHDFVSSVKHSREDGLPYINVEIDKEEAAKYGLTTATIATTIDTYQNGSAVSRYSIDDTEIDIVVKTDTDSKESIAKLEDMEIQTPTGQIIPLSKVAKLVKKESAAAIEKVDKMNVVSFTLNYQNLSQSEAQSEIEKIVDEMNLPSGYKIEYTGATKELMDSIEPMILAIIIGIIVIYMILASQFESFKQPLIIMISIPFSFTGGLLTLALCRFPLSIPVLMGMLMLVGIIVNNAILIVDTMNVMRREEGMDLIPAIKKSCLIRLRPMLLTTCTTVLGLIPMALGLGEGTKLLQPMAIFVCGGLVLGSVLTLVVVPVLYLLIEKNSKKKVTQE